MFKVIKDENATTADLAQGYVSIERFNTELGTEYKAVYSNLVDLQQDALSGENVATKIKKTKSELTDIETKQQACARGLEQIKERLASLIPVEAEARKVELISKHEGLSIEEAGLYRDFFKACAVAIACREKIKGIATDYNSYSGELTESSPKLEVCAYSALMNAEDSVFLVEQVELERKKNKSFVPLKKREVKVVSELNKIEKMLEDFNPDIQVEKLIAASR